MLGCMKVEVEAKIYLLRYAFRRGFYKGPVCGNGRVYCARENAMCSSIGNISCHTSTVGCLISLPGN